MQIIQLLSVWYLAIKYIRLSNQKEHEYYTDYVHNELILRVYKYEFEHQAIGNVSRDKLLDGGNLNQVYGWALIQK